MILRGCEHVISLHLLRQWKTRVFLLKFNQIQLRYRVEDTSLESRLMLWQSNTLSGNTKTLSINHFHCDWSFYIFSQQKISFMTQKLVFCARHSVNLFIHRFGTVWNFCSLFYGLHENSTFFRFSQTLTNEGEHKSKFITNYYSWFWNIYSFLCRPNIIDTSILMFFLYVARSFNTDGVKCDDEKWLCWNMLTWLHIKIKAFFTC